MKFFFWVDNTGIKAVKISEIKVAVKVLLGKYITPAQIISNTVPIAIGIE